MSAAFIGLLIFLLKTLLIVLAILVTFAGILALASKGKSKRKGKLVVTPMREQYAANTALLHETILDKKALKLQRKKDKKKQQNTTDKARIFLLSFDGDIRAQAVDALRQEITAILAIATSKDEVVVQLASPGGVIHGYGLAASQLQRIKNHNIPLTIAIDMVAASGGYMMACVADKIIAAPFAIIGSIGAVMQMPNFHKWLKKHHIDFEQLTAGEFKRTLTVFGENDNKGRQKAQEELEEAHHLFKNFIRHHRPQVDIAQVATGEHWFAQQALGLQLVDELMTSDDYLFEANQRANIYAVDYRIKQGLMTKLSQKAQLLLQR